MYYTRISLSIIGLFLMLGLGAPSVPAQHSDMMLLRRPDKRAEAAERLLLKSRRDQAEAWAAAQRNGWALRGTANGAAYELIGVRDGRPIYVGGCNVNAAISTAANLVRQAAPYNLSGDGVIVGVWDGGAVMSNHQEFSGRVSVRDGSEPVWHSAHVGGTIGASGVNPAAKGMAPASLLYSYNWLDDVAELALIGAMQANQSGKIQLTNHSYTILTGWVENTDFSGFTGWHWFGQEGQREDLMFGIYGADAVQWDALCFSSQYVLPVRAAGNDRNDNTPPAGATYYYLSNQAWVSKSFNAATDPYADGWKSGYDTIPDSGCAKNVLTVGAVNDAVSGGARSLAAATMTDFSGWGPTDDGRVKPDIVANGFDIFSPSSESTSSYVTRTGTTAAAANASGSIALLLQNWRTKFIGQGLNAAALKALVVHGADDLGNPGPDFSFGWGLMNTKTSVDLVNLHADNPLVGHITQSELNTSVAARFYDLKYGGSGPLVATLCWTDPAGTEQSTLNSSTPALVNDLDLRITGPGGTPTYYPYILNPAQPSNAATTGDNTRDNVEQIRIAAPAAGYYRVTVSHKASLSNPPQPFALVVSGQTAYPNLTVSNESLQFGDKVVDAGATPSLSVTVRNAGNANLTFSGVTLTGANSTEFAFASSPSTAALAPGAEHVFTVVFAPQSAGTKSANLSIQTNDDDGVLLIPLSGRGVTIVPPVAQFASTTSNVNENGGTHNVTITLNEAAGAGGASVVYQIKGGTATAGADYNLASSGQVSIPAGATSGVIAIAVVNDAINESDETIVLQLSNPTNATLGTQSIHTVTIVDNDAPPTVGFASAAAQGNENEGSIQLQVVLTGNMTEKTVRFTATSVNGTAAAGADFVALAREYSIAPPARSVNVNPELLNDAIPERVETMTVQLSAPVNATLGAAVATVSISDDDIPPPTNQVGMITATSGWRAGAWDYSVGDWVGGPTDSTGNGSFGYSLANDHWVLLCLYDFGEARWVEGIYLYKQVWSGGGASASKSGFVGPRFAPAVVADESALRAAALSNGIARFSTNQQFFAKSPGNLQIGSWNYGLSNWDAQETTREFSFFNFPTHDNQWILVCLQNLDSGAWEQGAYIYRLLW
jgi:hypothetical protein